MLALVWLGYVNKAVRYSIIDTTLLIMLGYVLSYIMLGYVLSYIKLGYVRFGLSFYLCH